MKVLAPHLAFSGTAPVGGLGLPHYDLGKMKGEALHLAIAGGVCLEKSGLSKCF